MIRTSLALLMFSAMLLPTLPAIGADFQVGTEIFVGEEPEAATSQNETLFRGNIAYDFAPGNHEVTVFDSEAGRFILLDTSRQLKTEVTTNQLLAYAQFVRNEASSKGDKLLKFCANPSFKLDQQPSEKSSRFSSEALTYRVDYADPPDEEAVAQYRSFCDWFARLNAMMNPGALPPFPRMEVNAHLEQNQVVPKTIRLNIAPHARFGNREFHVRSEHDFRKGLAASDIAKIDAAQRQMVTFKTVSLDAYRNNDAPSEAVSKK